LDYYYILGIQSIAALALGKIRGWIKKCFINRSIKGKTMVILHIPSIMNNCFSVVAPQHIKAQERLGHDAALYNVNGV